MFPSVTLILTSASESMLNSVVSWPITMFESWLTKFTFPLVFWCFTIPWICIPLVPLLVTFNSEPFELIRPVEEISSLLFSLYKSAVPALLITSPSILKPSEP